MTVCGEIVDALDRLEDRPEASEQLVAYRLAGPVGSVHVQYSNPMDSPGGGWYKTATYAIVDPQPADEVMRDADRWREWAEAQYAAEQAALEPAGRST